MAEIHIAIVGAEEAKFTPLGRELALQEIDSIISNAVQTYNKVVIVSGHCHLGGIDIWAEEVASQYSHAGNDVDLMVFPPKLNRWDGEGGYKWRNMLIATSCNVIHNITVDHLPKDFQGMKFSQCYHCARREMPDTNHVKSGGCWTMYAAADLGKPWHHRIIPNF